MEQAYDQQAYNQNAYDENYEDGENVKTNIVDKQSDQRYQQLPEQHDDSSNTNQTNDGTKDINFLNGQTNQNNSDNNFQTSFDKYKRDNVEKPTNTSSWKTLRNGRKYRTIATSAIRKDYKKIQTPLIKTDNLTQSFINISELASNKLYSFVYNLYAKTKK